MFRGIFFFIETQYNSIYLKSFIFIVSIKWVPILFRENRYSAAIYQTKYYKQTLNYVYYIDIYFLKNKPIDEYRFRHKHLKRSKF